MNITLLLNPAGTMQFHVALANALRAKGFRVAVKWQPMRASDSHNAIAALLLLEDCLYSQRINPLTKPAGDSEFPSDPAVEIAAPQNLTINFSTATADASGSLSLLFDGQTLADGLWAALLDGRAPHLSLVDGEGHVLANALPAIEDTRRIGIGADQVLARAIDLILIALKKPSSAMKNGSHTPVAVQTHHRPALFFARNLACRIRDRINGLIRNKPHWQVGFRPISGANDPAKVANAMAWPVDTFSLLPGDGARYYADPFPVVAAGKDFIFVEEFPYATGKGILSVATIGADGSASTPVPCLETDVHLSYPHVFQHQNQWYMIPESCAANRIDLYRAREFPLRWEFSHTIMDKVPVSDATLLLHNGKYWLLGTVGDAGRSTWDALHAWYADDLFGPWRAHAKNPLLIDAACARPAGHCFINKGRLVRPVQNCVGGYGTSLAFAEVKRLDEQDFDQRIIANLAPDPRWHAHGVHTLNTSERYEAIDFFA